MLSVPLSASDGVQDRGVGDLGLHREQSGGGYSPGGAISPVAPGPSRCRVISSMSTCRGSKVVCVFFFFPQVFDGAVIVLSLAPMVASTVANGPSSPWDAIGLIITLRIWRVKRIIDGEWGWGWGGGPDGCPLLSGHTDGYCNTLSALQGILRLVPQSFMVQNLIKLKF